MHLLIHAATVLCVAAVQRFSDASPSGLAARVTSMQAKPSARRRHNGKHTQALDYSRRNCSRPHIIHIVADDLGYNDIGSMNGGKTLTPNIDALISDGVRLDAFYADHLCAPSRASSMTGRYPWGIGFYDMYKDSDHCVDQSFKMLPALLRDAGYRTHAVGKWDVGYIQQHCTPTFRGFETFFGFYSTCTSDYWYHGAFGGNLTHGKCGGIDMHSNTEINTEGAAMQGTSSVNGTYNQELFTHRAVDIIHAHADSHTCDPLYLYLAYHNVHDTGSTDRFATGLNAPKATVDLYETTILDTWKVQGAMTTELDYGVGNVTAALHAAGLWENSVIIFNSDNGGPLEHSSNWPLRGGKGFHFEGGYRVLAFVSGAILPSSVRGTHYDGIMHVSDWYTTIMDMNGIAQTPLPPNTGQRAPDGHCMWPAITGVNMTSPRTEVIHAVTNQYFNGRVGIPGKVDVPGEQVARFGKFKIIVSHWGCELNRVWQAWPSVGDKPVAFGLSGGKLEMGTDHARAPLLDAATLLLETDVGAEHRSGNICLYNLESDSAETTNLASLKEYADIVSDLTRRLEAHAATGPPETLAGPTIKVDHKGKCQHEAATGYLDSVDAK